MNLKTIRKSKGLSQDELARRSGVKVTSIRSYEQGKRNIDKAEIENLSKLALTLECSVSDLLNDNELKKIVKKTTF